MRSLHLIVLIVLCTEIPARAQERISVVAHQDFGLSFKDAWTARFSESDITVERPSKKQKSRRLSEKELVTLRQALETSGWATLQATYGCPGSCDDYPRCSLDVRVGNTSKRIVIYQAEKGVPLSTEVQRLLTLWKSIKKLAGVEGLKDACP